MVEMLDLATILQAIVISAGTAGIYAFLGWLRAVDPDTGNPERFESAKFLTTMLLAVVVGGIAGALDLPDALAVEEYLGPGFYPLLVIFVQMAAQAVSRRLGWT